MNFIDNIKQRVSGFFETKAQATPQYNNDLVTQRATLQGKDDDIFKAYIPNFLYKPPYGYPRRENVNELKILAGNPYVFSVIKTLKDEISSLDWEINVKDEFQDDDMDYSDKINEVIKFFKNPNKNEESFGFLLRKMLQDLFELDSGVIVKVFNMNGDFSQLMAYDGATFLKNPDIYGSLGDRAEFVAPLPDRFRESNVNILQADTPQSSELIKMYDGLYKQRAAYFQYGWTAGSMPVPFGRREVIYFMQNPRGDNVYGTSPVRILYNIILSLVYGAEFNLDYYRNNNIPEGVIQILGASNDQIRQFRANFNHQFREKDALGIERKRFFNFPISSQDVKFTPFQITSKDMEVISQQQWFTKILWSVFGVNAEEMGFTEDSNRSVGVVQNMIVKRKAIKPLLRLIEYHFNTQLMPEFFPENSTNEFGIRDVPDFSEVPLEFKFNDYDFEEDKKHHDILEQEIRMGVKTPMMAAKELGINIEELKAEKEEAVEEQQEMLGSDQPVESQESEERFPNINKYKEDINSVEDKSEPISKEEKPKEQGNDLLKEMDSYIEGVSENIQKAIDNMNQGEF